ncbi:MAG: hypothetical protein KAV82_04635 [Phycisphaerae bacterium]|nr:hypothetical protein [Phycisphaerae bacterium]
MTAARLVIILLLLGTLNLLSVNLGPLAPTTSRALALACLVIVWFVSIAMVRRSFRRSLLAIGGAVGAGLVTVGVMLSSPERSVWLCAACLNVFCLSWLWGDEDVEQAGSLRAFGFTSVVYLLFFVIVQHVPPAWNGLQAASLAVSESVGHLVRTNVVQGASTGGVYVFVTLICYLAARAGAGLAKRWLLFTIGAVALVLLLLGQMAMGPVVATWSGRALFDLLSCNPQVSSPGQLKSSFATVHSPVLLLAAGCLVVLVLELLWKSKRGDSGRPTVSDRGSGGHWGVAVGAVCLSGLVCYGLVAPSYGKTGRHDGTRRVLFFHDGNEGLRSFSVPGFKHFGLVAAGMFGMLPEYLWAWGFQSVTMDPAAELDAPLLADYDVFVVISPTERFSEERHRAIWRYVEQGGALLVLGDHTDIAGSMEPLNDLLQPVGIRFNFDSAFTATQWVNAYEVFPHPTTVDLDAANQQLRHSTGASLSIDPGVVPVVSARWGFSDLGNRANAESAFLGDYAYQFFEPMSDVVVIAEARYGKGKVLVFGDTSAFQNNALAHSNPFLERVFGYLADAPGSPRWLGYLAAPVLLLMFAFTSSRHVRLPRSVPSGLIIVVPSLLVLALVPALVGAPSSQAASGRRVAYVDAAHVNRFALESWLDDSVGGLLLNLMRNGYLPKILLDKGDLSHIRGADIFVVIAPAMPYSDTELATVREFMETGGLLILSAGAEEKSGAGGLLDMVGMDIGDMPLGPIPIDSPLHHRLVLRKALQAPHFREAWPVLNKRSDPIESFYQQDNYDIIGFRSIGRGGALVIGDSWFLHDNVLEAEQSWWPGNIKLLRSILEELRSRREGA